MKTWHWGMWLMGTGGLGWQLDGRTWEVFSNHNDSVIAITVMVEDSKYSLNSFCLIWHVRQKQSSNTTVNESVMFSLALTQTEKTSLDLQLFPFKKNKNSLWYVGTAPTDLLSPGSFSLVSLLSVSKSSFALWLNGCWCTKQAKWKQVLFFSAGKTFWL